MLEHAGMLDENLTLCSDVRIVLLTSWVVVYGGVLKAARR